MMIWYIGFLLVIALIVGSQNYRKMERIDCIKSGVATFLLVLSMVLMKFEHDAFYKDRQILLNAIEYDHKLIRREAKKRTVLENDNEYYKTSLQMSKTFDMREIKDWSRYKIVGKRLEMK